MKLCEYGCGNIATHQFKNGKWCCCKNSNKCKGVRIKSSLKKIGHFVSNETRNKMKKPKSEDHKKKIGLSRKGKNAWNKNLKNCFSEETLIKMKESHIGKKQSKEQCEKQRQFMLNGQATILKLIPRNPEKIKINGEKTRKRLLNGGAKHMNSFPVKGFKNHKEWMINGGAVYLNSKISNPSKPQVELYNRIKELYSNAELNYPCYRGNGKKSYSLDVAIPELKICFESDGSRWHPSEEDDIKRQNEIEELGWKVIRYKADSEKQVPSKEKIKEDIIITEQIKNTKRIY